MVKNILIIGQGSISLKHKSAIKLISKKIKIKVLPSRKFNNSFCSHKSHNFDLIIVCSPSPYHYEHFKIINKNFRNTKVLMKI